MDTTSGNKSGAGQSKGAGGLAARLVEAVFSQAGTEGAELQAARDLGLERRTREIQGRDTAVELEHLQVLEHPPRDYQRRFKPFLSLDDILSSATIPGLPAVYLGLVELLGRPRARTEEIAGQIMLDPGLAVLVLRIANSLHFSDRSGQKIDSIHRAVMIIGNKQLATVAMGMSILTAFRGIPSNVLDMRSVWRQGVAVGVLASELGQRAGLKDTERLFVLGMLLDVGRLFFLKEYPEREHEALVLARQEWILLSQAESQVIGADARTVGARLAKRWNFPGTLTEPIEELTGTGRKRTKDGAVLQVAAFLARALGLGMNGELFVLPPEPEAWARSGLGPADLQAVAGVAEGKLDGIMEAFPA